MEFTAKMIADFLKGTIVGNPDVVVSTVAKIENAEKGTLAFLANEKYTKHIYTTGASIVLINESLALEQAVPCTLIKVKDAYASFAQLLNLYEQSKPKKQGISQHAAIAKTAKVGDNAYIGDFVSIGENVKIGNNVQIFPGTYIGDNSCIGNDVKIYSNASVYHECVIGNKCIIHAGAVIGSDGFGFAPNAQGGYDKIPQIGNVIIEDDVEIGANTTIDRATMGSTIIRKGAKLDNLIQAAHNVEIGEATVIAAQAGISGSAKIGKRCMIGGQAGIVGHIVIEDNVNIGAQSGVPNGIKEGMTVLGAPAMDIREAKKIMIVSKRLPDMKHKIDELEKEIAALKEAIKK